MSESTENKKGNAVTRKVLDFIGGDFLKQDNMMNNIPYLLFLFGIGIFYIGNSHYGDSNIIGIERMNRELKDLKSDFTTTRSELKFISKQSEIAKSVIDLGIYESVVPPKKIVITENEANEL